MRRRLSRKLLVLGACLAVLGFSTACEPLLNAPPGAGTVTVGTYRLGPFNLAPMGQSGWESQGSQSNIPKPPTPFGVKTMDFDLVDASGNPIPRMDVHLHHVLLMDTARQSQFCSNWPERFAGAGSERTPMKLPDPYAYMVNSGERWSAIWHIMNMTDQPERVYIQYKVGYQPNANASNSRLVTPFFLDVTGCGNSEYNVPGDGGPGSVHTKSANFTAPWDGMDVAIGGHQHAGGIDITLRDPATGDQCVMVDKYDGESAMGAPSQITTCPAHNKVTAGNTYQVISRYDNSEPRSGVMGIVLTYVWRGTQ